MILRFRRDNADPEMSICSVHQPRPLQSANRLRRLDHSFDSCSGLMDIWDRLKRWNNHNAFFAGFRVSDNRLRKSLSGLRL